MYINECTGGCTLTNVQGVDYLTFEKEISQNSLFLLSQMLCDIILIS